jgi:16S rRNA (cytidine1402-2'-O)-methyltransferase
MPGATGNGGRLMVVGTPIGNLGDMSPRAASTLREADLVVAEDTRMAARLLAHIGARTPTVSFTEHNAARRLPELLGRLAGGACLALTTDAGMPGVSDPGASLVSAARAAGHAVEVVPGPTAITTVMAVSGAEAGGFLFGGFLPARPAAKRRAALEPLLVAAGDLGLPLILYEAPHRIRTLLAELETLAPDAHLALGRELTKRHEEVLVGTPTEVRTALREERGEVALVVSGLAPADGASHTAVDAEALARAAAAIGLGPRSISDLLRAAGVDRRRAYRLATEAADRPR